MNEQKSLDMLIDALLSLRTREECAAFLEDVMTRKETEEIAQRLLVAKLLTEQVVYNRIVEETGASTTTISRVNRCCVYGAGGYATVLNRLKERETSGENN